MSIARKQNEPATLDQIIEIQVLETLVKTARKDTVKFEANFKLGVALATAMYLANKGLPEEIVHAEMTKIIEHFGIPMGLGLLNPMGLNEEAELEGLRLNLDKATAKIKLDKLKKTLEELHVNPKLPMNVRLMTFPVMYFALIVLTQFVYWADILSEDHRNLITYSLLMNFVFIATIAYKNAKKEFTIKNNLYEKLLVLQQFFPEDIRKQIKFDDHGWGNSKSSLLVLKFGECEFDITANCQGKLTGARLCLIVKKVFEKHNITIKDHMQNVLMIAPDDNMQRSLIQTLQKEIDDAVDAYINLKKLTKQIEHLMKVFGMEGHHRPAVDAKGEETEARAFYYTINENFKINKNFNMMKLKSYFPKAKISIEGDILEIIDNAPSKKDVFSEVKMYDIKAPVLSIKSDKNNNNNSVVYVEHAPKYVSPAKSSKSSKEEKKEVQTTPSAPLSEDDFRANEVKPLQGQGIPEGVFYVRFGLHESDFGSYPHLYKYFYEHFDKLATARMGKEGQVFGKVIGKDLSGKNIVADSKEKIKAPGYRGARMFFVATEEIVDGHKAKVYTGVGYTIHHE